MQEQLPDSAAHSPAELWFVLRVDDTGNTFVVRERLDKSEADRLADALPCTWALPHSTPSTQRPVPNSAKKSLQCPCEKFHKVGSRIVNPAPILTPAGVEPAFDLAAYYPILIYAVVIVRAGRRPCSRPRNSSRSSRASRRASSRCPTNRAWTRSATPAAVRRQVLPDRHPVPRLRRGTAVPLSVGGDRLPRRRRPAWRDAFGTRRLLARSWSSWPRWSSPTSTPGGRGCSNGGEALPTTSWSPKLDYAGQLGAQEQPVADAVRHGLLRHRADGDRASPLRHRPLRRRGDALQPAAVRPDDRRRPRGHEDGAGAAAHLAANAGAEVVHLDGRLRLLAAASSTPTPWCRASTASCRWTCTCPAVRRGRSS